MLKQKQELKLLQSFVVIVRILSCEIKIHQLPQKLKMYKQYIFEGLNYFAYPIFAIPFLPEKMAVLKMNALSENKIV